MTDALYESMNHVVVVACAAQIGRCGGVKDLELGFARENVPIDQAGWYAKISYLNRTLLVDEKPSLAEAAFEMVSRLMNHGRCLGCLREVEVVQIPGTGEHDHCERYIEGEDFVKGCDKDKEPDAPEPTRMRLARDLHEAKCPTEMILAAAAGYYDDYLSPNPMSMLELYAELKKLGKDDMAEKVTMGEWDAQKWESDAWAASPEGQEAMTELGPMAEQIFNQKIKPKMEDRMNRKQKRQYKKYKKKGSI